MTSIRVVSYHTPFGELLLGSFQETLCLCDWRYRRMRTTVDARIQRGLNAAYEEGTSPVIEETIAQLKAYFLGDRTTFDVPLVMVGTEFQKRVWNALLAIPCGTTGTYSSLSAQVADATAIRAVAAANGANAISILVPCHRIVGSTGELVGYAGGLPVKRKLLQLEGAMPVTQDLFSMEAEA